MSSEVPLSNGASGMPSSRDEAHRSEARAGRRQLGLGCRSSSVSHPFRLWKDTKRDDLFFIFVGDTAGRAEVVAPKSSSFASLCDIRGHFDAAPFSVE